MTIRIGVDIGGTFTDLVMYDEESGEVAVEKVTTTPAAPEEGCVAAVWQAVYTDMPFIWPCLRTCSAVCAIEC